MKRLFQLLIIAVAILILGDMAARSQGTGAGGSGPWTLSGTIILPKSASVDWVRITGDAAGPRIGSTAGNDILFDPDNDGASEASISNVGGGTFDSIVTADKEASDEGNYISVFDDDAAGGTAFDGTAGNLTIGDIDESATDNYCFFLDTTSKFCIGATIVTTADWDFSGGGIAIESGTTPPACTGSQLYLDTDATSGSRLMACESGTFVTQGGGGGFTSFDIDGDNNSPQTITNGNEALFVGGVGIDTTAGATDQVSFAFDETEITGARSWSTGAADTSIAWTFNLSTGTDPVLTAQNNNFDFSTPITATSFTADDQQQADGGNYTWVLDDDHTDGAVFAGVTDAVSLGDIDEAATDTYCFFNSATKVFCLPATTEVTGLMGISSGAYVDVDTVGEVNTSLGSTKIREAFEDATDCVTNVATGCDAVGEGGNICHDQDDDKVWICEDDGTPAWVQMTASATSRLDQITDPNADKTFSMGTNRVDFSYTTPNDLDGAFGIDSTGAFTNDLVEIAQTSTSVLTGANMLHIQQADADATPIRISSTADTTNQRGIIFESFSGTPVNEDDMGVLEWWGYDSTLAATQTGAMVISWLDTTNTSEDSYLHWYAQVGGSLTEVLEAKGATLTIPGQYVTSLTTGTAPLSVASTTKVTNLNVDQLDDVSMSTLTDEYPCRIDTTPNPDVLICDTLLSEAQLASEDYGSFTCGASADDCLLDATVGGRSLTTSSGNLDADAELYTDQVCIHKTLPATSDQYYTVWRAPVALTATEIYCEVTGGTSVAADLNNDDGTPTGVNGADITCSTSGTTDGTLGGDAAFAAGDRLDVDVGTVTGTVTQFSICMKYTKDD